MRFCVHKRYLDKRKPISENIDLVFEQNLWDDFGYKVTFVVYYPNGKSRLPKDIGNISIANLAEAEEMKEKNGYYIAYGNIPKEFEYLDKDWISLGTTEYYEGLIDIFDRQELNCIFESLNDMAYDLNLFNKVKNKAIIQKSFLRGVSEGHLKGKLNRLATSDKKSPSYEFNLSYFINGNENKCTYTFDNKLKKFSNLEELPSNTYAIIGKNGSGKSKLLYDIYKASLNNGKVTSIFSDEKSKVEVEFSKESKKSSFIGTMLISFSAFDKYYDDLGNGNFYEGSNMEHDLINKIVTIGSLKLDFSKLNKKDDIEDWKNDNANNFINALNIIWKNNIKKRFFNAKMHELGLVDKFIDEEEQEELTIDDFLNSYSNMSSGEKILSLGLSHLLAYVEENMLVLIDEPELYLHPPYISSYIRIISDIMNNTNGLAIIVTNSPIILQEIVNEKVLISKLDIVPQLKPIKIATFGESLSIINNEVFGLDLKKTGFYEFLDDLINDDSSSEEDILDLYNSNVLGSEAKFYLAFLLNKNGKKG